MTSPAPTADTPVIWPLESIIERLPLPKLFPAAPPLEVELGSGDGSFLVEYARRHPELSLIGIERLLGRLRKLERKARRARLENIRAIRIESSYFLRFLLPGASVSALHIYFPDPWPKRKHARHRLVNSEFPALASQVLAPGGVVYLRTDSPEYFQQMLEVFAASPLFVPTDTPLALQEIVTDFEREFHKQGVPTNRAAYRSRQPPV